VIAAGAVVLVRSDSHVFRDGVAGLLPEPWRRRTRAVTVATDLDERHAAAAIVVDGDAEAAATALTQARASGIPSILIVGSRRHAPEVLEAADAVLLRDELESLSLRLALAAGRAGVRVLPRTLPVQLAPPADPAAELGDAARQVLALLAAGMRDAEIARELSISESAVRKLVQRTVRALGARTRSQAVAIVARGAATPASG
jgi:DNA-binding NarL/FixJ family response regulator